MKAVYAASALIDKRIDKTFPQKLNGVFMPNSIGRLVHRSRGRNSGSISIYRRNDEDEKDRSISCTLTTLNKALVRQSSWQENKQVEAIYIPVKDMLANAPGFRSLVSQKKIAFEEVYLDIIDKAFNPVAKGKLSVESERLLDILHKGMSGKVIVKEETFYLKNSSGELEFPLLAEGFRKLGLLYKLIQNETLTKGTMLFWDEPEANLNPKLAHTVVRILLELQRMGVQIFISTHDYILLKEFELAVTPTDDILYHVLYKDNEGVIQHESQSDFELVSPNAIDETFSRILDDEIKKGLSTL